MQQRDVSKDEVVLDQGLIARIAAGDQEAFAALYDRLATQAYSLALYVTKDAGAAEDVVQEAFVNIWRMAGSYTVERGSVGAWAMTVVRNRAVDHLRRVSSRPQIASDLENVVVATPHDEVWASVAQELDAETIREAMSCLPPEQREADGSARSPLRGVLTSTTLRWSIPAVARCYVHSARELARRGGGNPL